MNNREFFNSMAEKWDSTVSHNEEKIKAIFEMVQIKEDSKVLDVGTGTGILIPHLNLCVGDLGRIVAVDIAEKMIEIAQLKFRFKNVDFVVGDVLEMKLPENYFNYIICYSMFPHFKNKQIAVAKLADSLMEGGKFVICHTQSREEINNFHRKVSEAVKNDNLPSAEKIEEYYHHTGIETTSVVDNDKMFVVIGRKLIRNTSYLCK
jgi:demethylmenaquinone methyltransferase/2-methoxy-6-polyprenyl-1,4-benzoquinol methylase